MYQAQTNEEVPVMKGLKTAGPRFGVWKKEKGKPVEVEEAVAATERGGSDRWRMDHGVVVHTGKGKQRRKQRGVHR